MSLKALQGVGGSPRAHGEEAPRQASRSPGWEGHAREGLSSRSVRSQVAPRGLGKVAVLRWASFGASWVLQLDSPAQRPSADRRESWPLGVFILQKLSHGRASPRLHWLSAGLEALMAGDREEHLDSLTGASVGQQDPPGGLTPPQETSP